MYQEKEKGKLRRRKEQSCLIKYSEVNAGDMNLRVSGELERTSPGIWTDNVERQSKHSGKSRTNLAGSLFCLRCEDWS